jgi:tetratricopeptide (TPR) repeat protein
VLFLVWFAFCIVTTVTKTMPVANVAHGAGLILGVLIGTARTLPSRRVAASGAVAALVAFSLWGATIGRPRVNLSGRASFEEGQWGYNALIANRNQEAARWLQDATTYQPNNAVYWFDLGIADQRVGKTTAAMAAYQRAHAIEPNHTRYSSSPGRSSEAEVSDYLRAINSTAWYNSGSRCASSAEFPKRADS